MQDMEANVTSSWKGQGPSCSDIVRVTSATLAL